MIIIALESTVHELKTIFPTGYQARALIQFGKRN